MDPYRRAFLRPTSGRIATRPPWAIVEAFEDACTRCGACASSCPENIIVTGDGGFPEIDFRKGACTLCARCASACPAPVFGATHGEAWRLKVAIADGCFAAQGIVCWSCRESCPAEAIRLRPVYRSAPRPDVEAASCTGCGACVSACPANAISLSYAAGEAA
jgi:ferredoxin-type protein NapF